MLYSIQLRPKKFDEVYGQPSTTKEMINRRGTMNWPSAILLKGASGTGKSTLCQIIAMTLQCEHLDKDNNPCCQCSSCNSIMEERFDRNTVRIDGSQSSKGEVVDFVQSIGISPMYDKNNVYIIEESDQLSKEAKLSLLKVLEKLQKNTYFILLSMYATGLPPEIQSRCQVYNLKSFNIMDTMYALKACMEKLGLWESEAIPKSFRLEGLRTIAESSQGSLRAAIQYLEKCIIGEYWTSESIRDNLGIIDKTQATNLLKLLLDCNPEFIREFEKVDIKEFFDYTYTILSSSYSHNISNYKYVNDGFEASTKLLGNHPMLDKLLQIYDSIFESSTYLKKSFVLSKLSRFISSNEQIMLQQKINDTNSPTPPVIRRVVRST